MGPPARPPRRAASRRSRAGDTGRMTRGFAGVSAVPSGEPARRGRGALRGLPGPPPGGGSSTPRECPRQVRRRQEHSQGVPEAGPAEAGALPGSARGRSGGGEGTSGECRRHLRRVAEALPGSARAGRAEAKALPGSASAGAARGTLRSGECRVAASCHAANIGTVRRAPRGSSAAAAGRASPAVRSTARQGVAARPCVDRVPSQADAVSRRHRAA